MLREFCFKYFLQATESDEDAYGDDMVTLDVSKSPEKPINEFKLYNANVKCKIVDFDSLENPVHHPLSFQLPE